MGSMTSVSSILKSVGIDYQALTAQVRDSRRAAEAGDHSKPDALEVERLACALEQLAHRLAEVGDHAERHFGDFYLDDMAHDVVDAVNDGGKDPVETLRSHLGLDGSQPLLPASSVFGFPDLRLVSHMVPDYGTGTFTLSSYLVDVRTGDVTPVPGGPQTAAEAAAAVKA